MVDDTNRLRIQKWEVKGIAAKAKITVNTNYRKNVGYRATLQGKPGAFCDSTHSPEEAVGKLLITWLTWEKN